VKNCRREVLELLRQGNPMSIEEICLHVTAKRTTVTKMLATLHAAQQVYVWDWKKGGSKQVAIWALGSEEDAPRITFEPKIAKAAESRNWVVQQLREFCKSFDFGPFATAMWNVAQGAR
jgi:predicted transcriptional regulator